MAERPWVTPQDVREYTDRKSVANRTDERLMIDISRAEMWVIRYTNNRFDDAEKFPEIPAAVRTAVILLAELYASDAADIAKRGGKFRSESFDDYSYTKVDVEDCIRDLDLGALLDDYIVRDTGNMNMRMRRL